MHKIELPFEKDRGYRDQIFMERWAWLSKRGIELNWRFESKNKPHVVVYFFDDKNEALLFKMVWG